MEKSSLERATEIFKRGFYVDKDKGACRRQAYKFLNKNYKSVKYSQ